MVIKNGNGIVWPDNKRIALMLTFDFDVEWLRYSREGRRSLGFADRSRGEYAIEEGLTRCLRVLDKQNVESTFFVPGKVAETYPEEVKKIAEMGHEIAYHGWEHEDSIDMTQAEEFRNMERAEAVFRKLTGKKPTGARGCWNMTYAFTPELLRKRGYKYSSVMKNCDYAWMYPGDAECPLIEFPVDHTFDDYTFFFFTFNTPQHRSNYPIDYVFDYWTDAFEELASEGDKIMVLKLHPQLIGRASRAVLLDRFITYAKDHDAWIASCNEVADYILEQEMKTTEERRSQR